MTSSTFVRVEPASIPLGDSAITNILRRIQALDSNINLTALSFVQRVGTPLVYDYELVAEDGRVWNQVLTFADPEDVNPGMTFDVPDPWKISENSEQRDLRDQLVKAKNALGLLGIRVNWLSDDAITIIWITGASLIAPGSVTVNWTSPNWHANDWIGVFHPNAPNTSYLQYHVLSGGPSGSHTFTISQPGDYELRYLPNNLYVDTARSLQFTVA
jgi:hypothetical protein